MCFFLFNCKFIDTLNFPLVKSAEEAVFSQARLRLQLKHLKSLLHYYTGTRGPGHAGCMQMFYYFQWF